MTDRFDGLAAYWEIREQAARQRVEDERKSLTRHETQLSQLMDYAREYSKQLAQESETSAAHLGNARRFLSDINRAAEQERDAAHQQSSVVNHQQEAWELEWQRLQALLALRAEREKQAGRAADRKADRRAQEIASRHKGE